MWGVATESDTRMRHHHSHHARARRHEQRRAHIVARLIAAERALPAAPDLAALHLDGILSDLLAISAPGAATLEKLERRAPALAWRLRLALQAPDAAARLAHCWALLDLLTQPPTRVDTPLHAARRISSALIV